MNFLPDQTCQSLFRREDSLFPFQIGPSFVVLP